MRDSERFLALFYNVGKDEKVVEILNIMTIEEAHKQF
jgi:hypothetical protein